uniref:Secreted protein n=1 Tax=Parascaris univalens TaxID=6257 RepID=A0A915A360_PARUN
MMSDVDDVSPEIATPRDENFRLKQTRQIMRRFTNLQKRKAITDSGNCRRRVGESFPRAGGTAMTAYMMRTSRNIYRMPYNCAMYIHA